VNGKNIVTLGHSCGGGLALLMVSLKHVRPEGPSADVSYTSRHLALTRPRPFLIYSDSNTCAIPSITLAATLCLHQVHPLRRLLSSSSKSSMKFLPQPPHLFLSVPMGRT
jgi:acetyl esterase/lipase